MYTFELDINCRSLLIVVDDYPDAALALQDA